MQMGKEGFTPAQVAQITGLTFHSVNLWAKDGLIVPSILQSRGRGNTREYSFNDAIALKIAGELRAIGLPMQAVRRVFDYMRANKLIQKPLSEIWIVTDGVNVYSPHSEAELFSLILQPGNGEVKITLDLKKAVDDLNASIGSVQRRKSA